VKLFKLTVGLLLEEPVDLEITETVGALTLETVGFGIQEDKDSAGHGTSETVLPGIPQTVLDGTPLLATLGIPGALPLIPEPMCALPGTQETTSVVDSLLHQHFAQHGTQGKLCVTEPLTTFYHLTALETATTQLIALSLESLLLVAKPATHNTLDFSSL
jgi:hypothetical protein